MPKSDTTPNFNASPGPAPYSGRPLVSVVVPAYNETPHLRANLESVASHLAELADRYGFEIVIVNDGSNDNTGAVAEEFASSDHHARVIHHPTNQGLGGALRTGLQNTRGDYVVVLDADLSYSPEHVGPLLHALRQSSAQVAIASPYARDGTVREVPLLRRILSRWANSYLRLMTGRHLTAVTCMVRAYEGPFIRGLDLSSPGRDVNAEIIHQALRRSAVIVEIPAALDWSGLDADRAARFSLPQAVLTTLRVLRLGLRLALDSHFTHHKTKGRRP
ncbi:MAG: glycosyltransferase family 2 protein [Planctomycetota bacterium]